MTSGKILERLITFGPELIEDYTITPSRCVLATAVGIEVLRAFAIDAHPLPVNVSIVNDRYVRLIGRGMSATTALAQGGHVMVTAGEQVTNPKEWGAHVVIHLPALRYVLDLDLRQFRRPRYGLEPPPADVFPWPRGRCAGEFKIPGGLLCYEVIADRGFERGRDWWDSARREPLVRALVRAVRRGRS